jgi:hypothetical protein
MRIALAASLLPAAAILLLGSSAAAETATATAPTPTTSAPPVDDGARYAWLDAQLAQIEMPTERWFTGWTWTFAWLAVGQGSLTAASPTAKQRELSGVGVGQAVLGLGAMLMAPNTLRGARARLNKMDVTTADGQYARRKRAEYVLAAVAAEEQFEHSPIPYILAGAVNLGGAAILWRGFDQPLAAAGILAAGSVVTTVQILSRPFSATRAWAQYKKDYSPNMPAEVPPDQINISLGVGPTGVAAIGTF